MQNITKIIVALDYSYMDDILLQTCKKLIKVVNLLEIHFIHVIPKYISKVNIPARLNKIEKNLTSEVHQLINDKIESQKLFNGQTIKYVVHIKEGSASQHIIEKTNSENFDLLILGKKILTKGSGLTPRRIAKNIRCNVMIVPEKASSDFSKILVPMDFSEDSIDAFKMALKWEKTLNSTIQLVHILLKYRAGYYLDLELNNEHYLFYIEEAKKEWNTIVHNLGIEKDNYPIEYVENPKRNNTSILLEYIDNYNIDFVIMGAQGKSNFQKLVYGSVTENFVDNNSSSSTLIVR